MLMSILSTTENSEVVDLRLFRKGRVHILNHMMILITQDEYFVDLKCFDIQFNILNSGLSNNFSVIFILRCPGFLSRHFPFRNLDVFIHIANMVQNRNTALLFFYSTSDSTQRSHKDAVVLLTSGRTTPTGKTLLLQFQKDTICKCKKDVNLKQLLRL